MQTTPSNVPTQTETTPDTPRKLSRRGRREISCFLIPAFLFQFIWGWYPLLVAFGLSFTSAKIRGANKFVGLENYVRVWNDPLVAKAFSVTLIYAGLSIVLTFLIPIFVAILLMEMPPRTMRWMMLLWFLPLSGISSTILWRYFYNPDVGILQQIIIGLGLPEQTFLTDPKLVLFWLIFPSILLFGPGLIYIASLQSIPTSYYEAAEIEGASFWRKIWTISLPRLRPIISMMLIFSIIASMQVYEWPRLMTDGGPGGASRTVVMYMFEYISALRLGDAVALSVYLFLIVVGLVALYNAFFKSDPDR
jgi:multiple sugar transport system permease protein